MEVGNGMTEENKESGEPGFVARQILTGDGHFHFVTVTGEGLEILGEPSGEKTVITDLPTMRSLNGAVLDWLRANTCPAFLVNPDPQGAPSKIPCELKTGHGDQMHFGRRYDPTWSRVVGVVYWSDDNHAAEFHNAS